MPKLKYWTLSLPLPQSYSASDIHCRLDVPFRQSILVPLRNRLWIVQTWNCIAFFLISSYVTIRELKAKGLHKNHSWWNLCCGHLLQSVIIIQTFLLAYTGYSTQNSWFCRAMSETYCSVTYFLKGAANLSVIQFNLKVFQCMNLILLYQVKAFLLASLVLIFLRRITCGQSSDNLFILFPYSRLEI